MLLSIIFFGSCITVFFSLNIELYHNKTVILCNKTAVWLLSFQKHVLFFSENWYNYAISWYKFLVSWKKLLIQFSYKRKWQKPPPQTTDTILIQKKCRSPLKPIVSCIKKNCITRGGKKKTLQKRSWKKDDNELYLLLTNQTKLLI